MTEVLKKLNFRKPFLVSVLLYCTFFTLFVMFHLNKGFLTDFQSVTVWSTTSDVARIWVGSGDQQTVFQAAYSWYTNGVLRDPGWFWVTNLWPPGMTMIQFAIMHTVGSEGKFILALLALNSALWSGVLFQILKSATSNIHKAVVLAGFTYLLSSWMFEDWIMGPYFAMSSGFAIPFFLLSLFWFREKSRIVLASIALTISALTRVTSYLILQLAVLVGVLLIVYSYILPACRKYLLKSTSKRETGGIRKSGLTLLVILVIPIITVVGWTEFVTNRAHPGIWTYTVPVPGLAYGMKWRTTEDINAVGGGFVVAGGGNWACAISPDRCSEIAEREATSDTPYSGNGYYSGTQLRNMAIIAAVTNPISYVEHRLPVFWKFWSNGNTVFGILMGAVLLLSTYYAIREFLARKTVQSIFFILFLIANGLPLLWIHFQLNYFIPIHLVSACYLMFNFDKCFKLIVNPTIANDFKSLAVHD